jgi:hypothetical protein
MLPRHGVTIAINTPGVALTTSITADTCCNVLMRLSQNRVRTREHHWDLATSTCIFSAECPLYASGAVRSVTVADNRPFERYRQKSA